MEVDYAVKVGESSVGVIHLKETIVQMISGWGILEDLEDILSDSK